MTGLSKRPLFGALLLTVLFSSAAAPDALGEPAAMQESASEFAWEDCLYAVDKRSAVRCGELRLTGAAPATLPVVVVQRDSGGLGESAVLYLQGGPGGASWLDPAEFDWPYWTRYAGLERDLVIFDQRGTGLADPSLACWGLRDTARRSLAIGWFSDESATLANEAMIECRERLVAEGYDLEQFTTRRNAADVVALMESLPYSQWTLFGVSYGSLVALEVMRMQPEGLQSVILDGVLPPDVQWWLEEPVLLDQAIAKIGASCPMRDVFQKDCGGSAEDFRRSLDAVLDDLSRSPRWISVPDWSGRAPYKVRVDPAVVLYALLEWMATPDGAGLARDAITDAQRQDYALLDSVLEQWAYGSISFGLHEPVFFSVLCDMDGDWTVEEFARRATESHYYGAHIPDSANLNYCSFWSEGRAPADYHRPVRSSIPTLLLSGEYDSVTPANWGDRVAATLDRSYHFIVPRGGHVVLFTDPCAMRIMNAFLSDPMVEPDAGCLSAAAPFGARPQ